LPHALPEGHRTGKSVHIVAGAQIVLKCAGLRSSDLFAELDEAFSKLFTKSDDSTYVLGLVSETGELRIDDICKVTPTPEESVITDKLRIF
jgi:hypothetical protein